HSSSFTTQDGLKLLLRIPAIGRRLDRRTVPWHSPTDPVSAPFLVGVSAVVICHSELKAARWTDLVRSGASRRGTRRLGEPRVPAHGAGMCHFGHGGLPG